MNLYSTIRMTKQASAKETTTGSTDKERKKFLTGANCVELLDPERGHNILHGDATDHCTPLWPRRCDVKTDSPRTMAMQIRLYADSWDNTNVADLKERQERERTTSCGSSSSQSDSQSKR